MAFRFMFDANQPHQLAAIQNVVELFAGLPRVDAQTLLNVMSEVIPNAPEAVDFTDAWLEENLHAVQHRHNEEHPDAVLPIARLDADAGVLLEGVSNDSYDCPHFTLEMETGTGKTYVYFRTMHKLHKRYGLRKFIIVVPSVAILEGVKKTFEITKSHFLSLYGVNNFSLIEYDGGSLGRIGSFAKSAFPVVLLITQQSFHHAKNNFYRPTEKLAAQRDRGSRFAP
jgi:type III restriction enzyme